MKFRPPKTQPETLGGKRFIRYMQTKGWYCGKIGGGTYNIGWPDYYCYHPKYGHRWIEVKANRNKLKRTQTERFIQMAMKGDKIYVVVVNAERKNESELYTNLFLDNDNWRLFIV